MARMRSVKPEYWSDQDITRLPRDVRLLYIALWNFADEEARMPGDPRLVKSWCFPLDDDVTAATVDAWLDELEGAGKVRRYEVEGSKYLLLTRMSAHQKLDTRLGSRYPEPPEVGVSTPVHTNQSARTGVQTPTAHRLEGAKHVAGGREHVAGGRVRALPIAATPAGQTLLDEHLRQHANRPPRDVIRGTSDKIESLLDEGITPDVIRRALAAFRAKPKASPGLIPMLVNDIINEPVASASLLGRQFEQ